MILENKENVKNSRLRKNFPAGFLTHNCSISHHHHCGKKQPKKSKPRIWIIELSPGVISAVAKRKFC